MAKRVRKGVLLVDGKPGKVSEMILQFAQPMWEHDPGGPPDVQAVRNIMRLAEICWNLPMLEAEQGPEGPRVRKLFDDLIATAPPSVRRVLLDLLEDRKTEFASVPFMVDVSVEGTDMKSLGIIATARMP